MNSIMTLKRLEDFTPKVALKALNAYMAKENPSSNIRISLKNLNLIPKWDDNKMIKYVVSIGDTLYQIVAVNTNKFGDTRVSVYIDYLQLCGTRRWAKEIPRELENFTSDFALDYLKECLSCLSKDNSFYSKLCLDRLVKINNGILDSNMIKFVVSIDNALYHIAAIRVKENYSFISVVVDYSII